MKNTLTACGLVLAATISPAFAYIPRPPLTESYVSAPDGLSNATLLIVRHAEKTGLDTGLSAAGIMRAQVYAQYFQHFEMSGAPVHIDALVAAEDSDKSDRPRLTLKPLSLETGMVINQPCPEKAVGVLVDWLKQRPANQTTLIAWHHTQIGKLLAALGADPAAFLPNGHWPNDNFDSVVALRFDQDGHLIPAASRIIREPMAVDNIVWTVMDHPAVNSWPADQAMETVAER